MGWFSKRRHPWVRDASIAVWRLFADLDLRDAKKTRFDSLHDCFIRELQAGLARRRSAACGAGEPLRRHRRRLRRGRRHQVFQAKGFPYSVADLFGDAQPVEPSRRLLRDAAPDLEHVPPLPRAARLRVERVTYMSGDTWNVNPIALKRVERLYCKNERAVDRARLRRRPRIALVPVAAILVASIRLHFLDVLLHLRYRGPQRIDCARRYRKGEEMGWFEHGSTIIVFAPRGLRAGRRHRSRRADPHGAGADAAALELGDSAGRRIGASKPVQSLPCSSVLLRAAPLSHGAAAAVGRQCGRRPPGARAGVADDAELRPLAAGIRAAAARRARRAAARQPAVVALEALRDTRPARRRLLQRAPVPRAADIDADQRDAGRLQHAAVDARDRHAVLRRQRQRSDIAGALLSMPGVLLVLSRGTWSSCWRCGWCRAISTYAGDHRVGFLQLDARAHPRTRGRAAGLGRLPDGADGVRRGWSGAFAAGEGRSATRNRRGWPLAAALAFIVIGPSIIAYRCWGAGVQHAGPRLAAFFANLTPVFAALLSAALLGERRAGTTRRRSR